MARAEVVLLDAMGVLYRSCDDVAELVIPFLNEQGCSLSHDKIIETYERCSRGEFASHGFWERLGVSGDADDLDAALVTRHKMTPGALDFLRRMKGRGVAVSCLSNDVSKWSRKLRQRFGLTPFVAEWIISGDVGVRKPDPLIYKKALEILNRDAGECLFVDDRVKNLDAARRLGFHTAHFAANVHTDSGAHPRIMTFDQLDPMVDFPVL